MGYFSISTTLGYQTDILCRLDEREDGGMYRYDGWETYYYGRMLTHPVIAAIQAYLKELNGQGTVPHVYINKEFIGGSSDLLKLSHEQVKQKISAAASA